MNETVDNSGDVDNTGDEPDESRAGEVVEISDEDFGAVERRIHRGMYWTVAGGTIVCLFFNDWRVLTGFMLGGALSLLNYRWLHQATSAFRHAAQRSPEEAKTAPPPVLNVVRFALRHLISVVALAVASYFNLISVVAALIGLCAFVVAAMFEAFRQVYQAIIFRED